MRLAALVHDIGKPTTYADGHFHHHDVVGARLAERLCAGSGSRERWWTTSPTWSVTTCSRWTPISPTRPSGGSSSGSGPRHLDNLFALRRADDIGSGLAPDGAEIRALRARLDAELAAETALDRQALAVDGGDLIRELRLEPGPRLGRMLEALVEQVITDPALNERATLLLLAQGMLADMDEAARPDDRAAAAGGACARHGAG